MSDTSAARTTILVIDAKATLATVLCDGLSLHGFTTLTATTGREGIQIAHFHRPQLIVCDIGLPDISGYGVLEYLRSQPDTVAIPIILLTEQPLSKTFRRSMEHGADDYLSKPVDLPNFLRAVQTQLTKRAQLANYFLSAVAKSNWEQFSTPARWQHLEKQFNQIKPAPWFSLWSIQLQNYSSLYADYGHVSGQLVLDSIGQQLCQWKDHWHQPSFQIDLSYLGKDKFVVFVQAPATLPNAICTEAMATLNQQLQQPLSINNHRLTPVIALETIDYPTLADLTHLLAKQPDATPARLSLGERLRQAIHRDELQLYFQPQVDLTSGQVIGAEALVRWHIPGEDQILPIQLIPLAEENGLMLSLGEWTIKAALQQLSHWQTLPCSGLSMAVNLSISQLRSQQFIEQLMALVETTAVNPIMVDLELPERLLVDDLSRAKVLLAELQSRGFSTAIDDFGSGALSYLQYLPVNILKLDKCFVRNLHHNRSNQVIVRAIMEVAQSLNISTIANGVETARELSILKQLKCQSMQGYLFSPAISATDFETLLLESSSNSPNTSQEMDRWATLPFKVSAVVVDH